MRTRISDFKACPCLLTLLLFVLEVGPSGSVGFCRVRTFAFTGSLGCERNNYEHARAESIGLSTL
eukprot:12730121-Alexandrium_andersonii.AAC.1